MIEKYYEFHNDFLSFRVVQFVKDHRLHILSLRNMRSELDDLESIKSIEYDKTRVQSSELGDPTAQLALIKTSLENKIAEYEVMLSIYDRTMASLDEVDRHILEIMYDNDLDYPSLILQEEYHIEHSTFYRWRARAIDHFESVVTGFLPL